MREIKFRAWLKNENRMITNISSIKLDINCIYYDNNQMFSYERASFDEIELMQYVGLKDKNGVKIFEGDIVKHIKGNTYTVEFYNGGFKLLRFNIYEGKPVSYHDFEVRRLTEMEVIGNIYENKELLGWL